MAIKNLLAVLFFVLLYPFIVHAELNIPTLTQPVHDQANMFSPHLVTSLNQALTNWYDAGGAQIAILTIPSLEGKDLFTISHQTATIWKLGRKGKDDGLLLFFAKEDRKIRIEVGYGLEGSIPDAIAKRVINTILTPNFRQGEFDRGLLQALMALTNRSNPDMSFAYYFKGHLPPQVSLKNKHMPGTMTLFDTIFSYGFFVFFILFIIMSIISGRRTRRFGGSTYDSTYFGGSSHSGFGGGSSFGGGGGGFGGGGASGGW